MNTPRGDGAAPSETPSADSPGHDGAALPTASHQDGEYPRPQLVRAAWADLDGTWSFRHDDDDAGRDAGWSDGFTPTHEIVVPFPPESSASGVAASGYHPVVWYARSITEDDLAAAGRSDDAPRVLVHFGAVDHRADVWLNGEFLGTHEGGHTPFTLDATRALTRSSDGAHTLVVRAEDDPHDATLPRGKQDWHEQPHVIWYHRTTGIWQTVWLEAVPATSIAALRWTADIRTATAELDVRLRGRVPEGARVRAALRYDDEALGTVVVDVHPDANTVRATVPIARQRNGQAYEELVWSPETPRLIDAVVTLLDASGAPIDAVSSYLGIRSVGTDGGAFLLNDRPYDVRSVLNQGYWPESHLAAPSRAALRREVELIKELGFTATRLHQKIEDPRFLFWADRLGLLVWGEAPGAYAFEPLAVQRLVREWMDAVERDASHPSIVTWVPANESWGVQHIAADPAQQAYARALADVTRALDPTRPVISNDGWEHQNSDILSVHDYEASGEVLAETYADDDARSRLLSGFGPSGRRMLVGGAVDRGQPVMLTEFGGVNHQPGVERVDAWGYSAARDGADWLERITALYDAIRASQFLAGSCYTQFTDTLQETNGLLTEDREPKMPIEAIRRAVTGSEPRGS
ncbi:glycoside hydrolase family 2 TIM barrel-domain containing protein [Curtobacterium sp. ISL-83]|uniref:glycoside hydrolase family 2 TIM barrel-domain containing protein n=1 Tax=Curtobacterium sp. ISL-83 TaxID=2819145 RepID=UPI001BE7936E|nr:glycoside hydrolase family 2 TIM barrel-domain containing protein [Curtobacterium sp. ISL-83]MBT2503544.1 glycoside hydrolase family 2 [Curtobacterium sp. ISL-83]